MKISSQRPFCLVLVALILHSAVAPPLSAAQEATPSTPAISEVPALPAESVSSEAAAAVESVPADIGVGALESVDPAAAEAVAGAARAASPRGPRTFALPSGPSKTAVSPQAISLPAAEGSIQGMGESFSPVLSSGTGTFSVPIALPAGRAGVQPSLGLSYSSSSGNGPLGIGWSLAVPFIARQTDRGLPRYIDRPTWHAEEDRFLYNGGQELVAVDSAQAAAVDCAIYEAEGAACSAAVPTELAGWQQYRARVEGGFMRFFRSPDARRWVVQSPDGTRFDFGELPSGEGPPEMVSASATALETDAETPGVLGSPSGTRTRESGRGEGLGPRVYRWHLTRMSDSHGSTVYYRYRADQGVSYLDDIHYVSPHSCAPAEGSVAQRRACADSLTRYGRRVRLVWESRPDVWSSYVPGWRTALSLRLRRIEVTAAEGEPGSRTLVRRYHLAYAPESDSFHSLLASVQVEGRPSEEQFYTNGFASWRPRVGVSTVSESSLGERIVGDLLPPMRFGYERPAGAARAPAGFVGFDTTVRTSGASPPHSVDEARTDLFDVNADGLPDVVVTDPARYRTNDGRPAVGVFFNGFSGRDALPGVAGGFSAAVPVPMPSDLSGVMSLDNLNVVPMDIDGDGRSDYLHMPRLRTYGYFTPTRQPDSALSAGSDVSPAAQGWQFTHVPVALPEGLTDPRIDLGRDGARIKVMDVNNDHLVDVVRTTGTEMQTWLNLGWLPRGDGRFGSASFFASSSAAGGEWRLSTDPLSSCVLQAGIPLDFEDPEVRLADMNGDGLQDIVKIRRGRVIYWPGRGPGLWGDGPAACGRGEGDSRYVEMQTPPPELDIESSGVYLEDVDEDGAADVVQIGFRDVSIWLNKAGIGFTARAVLSGTPPSPAFLDRVRFADVDGSGTTDILWAVGDNYRWIDPMGGRQPRVLTSVDNGLGALTTLEYGSSIEDYLTDLAAAEACTDPSCDRFTWSRVGGDCDVRIERATREHESGSGQCTYRSGGSPVVSTVVRAVETTDRFDALGRDENVSRTEFAYHDGYYEGIEQEFRGFGAADATAIGNESHPTGITRTRFLQGRRPNAIAGDRLADNPDEALKGRESLTEAFDERGVYLSTSHATYAVRTLFPATADGRPAVSYAYVLSTDELRYDTTPFTRGTGTLSLGTVIRQGPNEATTSMDPPETVRIRGVDFEHISGTTDRVDNVGHSIRQTANGRSGDDPITSQQIPVLLGDGSSWLWRTERTWVDGDTQALGHTTHDYDPTTGDLLRTDVRADLPNDAPAGGYAFGAGTEIPGVPAPEPFVQGNQTLVTSSAFDSWGVALASCAGADLEADGPSACLRHAEVDLDGEYHQFPLIERTTVAPTGAEVSSLVTTATWDRGLDAILDVTDPNDNVSKMHRDGLGRITALLPPRIGTSFDCAGGAIISEDFPTVVIGYELTDSPEAQPVSRVITSSILQCYALTPHHQLQSVAYVDGLGRPRATLTTGDDEHAWVQSGVGVFTPRGTAERAHIAAFVDDFDPTPATAVAIPSTAHSRATYDAFGRARAAIAEDGSATWTSYHALSTDVCDPLDNDPRSPHYRTCTTARTDGHGRVVDQIQRNRQPGSAAMETYRLFTIYRQDGAVTSIRRAQTDGDGTDIADEERESIRTFVYDTVGRRIASTDPDTDSRTNTDPASNTWRYLFNRVGDLVAVRDPRGCGQNFYYDLGGRLVGERYVLCDEAQVASEDTVEELPASVVALEATVTPRLVDARYFFDVYPEWTGTLEAAAPAFTTDNPKGRATGV
ncbi:MAG: hypothetical protein IT379_42060, partial [Deltaproteobacteria bacterium]|nr:hypothetical protein [Deltaproteobacteria bacterium]